MTAPPPRQLPGNPQPNWANTSASWRGGFTATRSEGEIFFAKKIGRTGGFCERVRACWLRRKKKPTN